MDPHVEREGVTADGARRRPDGGGNGSDHDPDARGIRRSGRLLFVLVTLTLVVIFALIAVGAIRLWQS